MHTADADPQVQTVPVHRVRGTEAACADDRLAVEEPLEIRLQWTEDGAPRLRAISITMRTPGHDAELAVGFLVGEGLLRDAADVAGTQHCPITDKQTSHNVLTVHLADGVTFDAGRLERSFYTTSSCGVCGKTSLEALDVTGCPVLPHDRPVLDIDVIHQLPNTLRTAQDVFEQTGGLHAAALFTPDGELLRVREDVGRHNAVDKLVGSCFLDGLLPLHEHVLFVSGRTSFELAQKALMAGVPVLAAVSAPSSLAVGLAGEFGMTLLGFVRGDRFNVYAGAERVRGLSTSSSPLPSA